MALLFLSPNVHQVDEPFSVHSGGKRCAFMSLSALLTARNIPLFAWSFRTFNDNIYFRALFICLLCAKPVKTMSLYSVHF